MAGSMSQTYDFVLLGHVTGISLLGCVRRGDVNLVLCELLGLLVRIELPPSLTSK